MDHICGEGEDGNPSCEHSLIAQTEASRLMEKRDRYAQLLKKIQSDETRADILYIIGVLNDRINADINRRIREM